MLAVDGDEALVADAARKYVDLLPQFVHREDAALLQGVPLAEAAVAAPVHAEVQFLSTKAEDESASNDGVFDDLKAVDENLPF